MITRNGNEPRFKVEGGKNLYTDEKGKKAFEELRAKYVDKLVDNVVNRKMLRSEMLALQLILRKEGRLFRQDGSVIRG